MYDAIVVGAGPNGLAAAITLARAGLAVLVLEGHESVGGGTRTAALTLPGYLHDVCATLHPLTLASPFFQTVPLAEFGLEWIQPELPAAHPLDGGGAVALYRSLAETADALGRDGPAYRRLLEPIVAQWDALAPAVLGPLPVGAALRQPLNMLRFGLRAPWPASTMAQALFRETPARALFAGMAAHGMLPLESLTTAALGVMVAASGHIAGWPLARGGSHRVTCAMADYFISLGGRIETGVWISSLDQLPPARAILLDVSVRGFLKMAGEQMPPRYRAALERFRYGPGAFKIDWALSEPIPWTAEACRRAGGLHLGGTLEEIRLSEQQAWNGRHAEAPYVIVTQPTIFDSSRAPYGRHVAWAYCHVPHDSQQDMTAAVERQIERFAPGFRDCVLARHTITAHDYATYNPNYVGGDINSGAQTWRQFFTRPVARANPYTTPLAGIYLCSSATPPGGGVHGMCGYHAARAALARLQ